MLIEDHGLFGWSLSVGRELQGVIDRGSDVRSTGGAMQGKLLEPGGLIDDNCLSPVRD